MNSEQRKQVRQSLIDQGFERTDCTDDISATGEYTETWTHPEGTVTTLAWAPRDLPVQSPVESAPGMYDEPDEGLSLPLPVSAEEDRIPSGVVPANDLAYAVTDPTQVDPSVVAPFVGREVTITRYGFVKPQTLTGYPVDAWRFSTTALGIRVAFDKADPRHGDFIMLPDNAPWTIEATDLNSAVYRNPPKAGS